MFVCGCARCVRCVCGCGCGDICIFLNVCIHESLSNMCVCASIHFFIIYSLLHMVYFKEGK